MSGPGDRLHALAARLCSERTRRRLIDPAIADLQSEVGAARRTGSSWRTLRATAAGYLSIAKVLAIALAGDLRHEAVTWQPGERVAVRRGLTVAIVATAVAMGLFVLPLVRRFSAADPALLSLYLIPSALAFTLPFGLMLGVAWACHGAARTRKLAVAAIVCAALCSMGMFANLGWLTPEANQAFRETAFAAEYRGQPDRPLQRGFNELTLPAMRAQLNAMRGIEPPSEVRALEVAFYRKLALSAAAVPMVGVVLGLAYRRRWGPRRLTAAAIATVVAYIVVGGAGVMAGARLGLPTLLIGWCATALCSVAALLITCSRPRAQA